MRIYDETNDKKGGTTKLKTGDKVTFFASDGEDREYLRCSDQTVVCVETDIRQWPYTIGGEPVDELFDRIMYAN